MVRRTVANMRNRRPAGFYTEEIRQHGQRVGFEAVGLNGQMATLAHVDFHGSDRVGRYGVHLGDFETIVQQELGRVVEEVDLYVIDEIGRMECLSRAFVDAVARVLNGPVPVLATIAAKGGGFIASVKMRQDVEIVTVTTANRDDLAAELVCRIRSW